MWVYGADDLEMAQLGPTPQIVIVAKGTPTADQRYQIEIRVHRIAGGADVSGFPVRTLSVDAGNLPSRAHLRTALHEIVGSEEVLGALRRHGGCVENRDAFSQPRAPNRERVCSANPPLFKRKAD